MKYLSFSVLLYYVYFNFIGILLMENKTPKHWLSPGGANWILQLEDTSLERVIGSHNLFKTN